MHFVHNSNQRHNNLFVINQNELKGFGIAHYLSSERCVYLSFHLFISSLFYKFSMQFRCHNAYDLFIGGFLSSSGNFDCFPSYPSEEIFNIPASRNANVFNMKM